METLHGSSARRGLYSSCSILLLSTPAAGKMTRIGSRPGGSRRARSEELSKWGMCDTWSIQNGWCSPSTISEFELKRRDVPACVTYATDEAFVWEDKHEHSYLLPS